MAYTIHQTEGYVLRSSPQGEANRRIDLLTRELGVIRGTAQGVRYLKSKLRYTLTDFSRIEVSLVRGKDVWRIINASKCEDMFFDFPVDYRTFFLKVFSLISRLVTGESSEPRLYELVRETHVFLMDTENLTEQELFGLECLVILQLLYYLGYVGEEKTISFDRASLQEAYVNRKEFVSLINHALEQSGL